MVPLANLIGLTANFIENPVTAFQLDIAHVDFEYGPTGNTIDGSRKNVQDTRRRDAILTTQFASGLVDQ